MLKLKFEYEKFPQSSYFRKIWIFNKWGFGYPSPVKGIRILGLNIEIRK